MIFQWQRAIRVNPAADVEAAGSLMNRASAAMRGARRVAGCALLALLALCPSAEAQDVAIYTVHIQHSARSVEVRVNGIPVSRGDADRSTLVAQVSSFLIDGPNTIELTSVRHGHAGSPLSFVLRRRTSDGSVDVASLPDLDGETAGERVRRKIEVSVALPVTWSWERADDFGTAALGPAERSRVIEVVRALHSDLAAGHVDEAVDRLEIVYREMGLLRPGIVDRVRGQMREWMRDPGWRIAPLDVDRLEVRPHGRLVRVSSDVPLIESASIGEGNSRFRLSSVFLAKIDGQWRIVRRGT